MRTRILPALLAVMATLVLGTGTSVAAAPVPAGWSVTPGGAFTGRGGPVDPPLACDGTDIAGVYSTVGNPLGTINRITYRNCTMFGLPTLQIIPHLPWTMNGLTYANGVTTMSITGIAASVNGTGCSFTAAGSATATYSNTTGLLTVVNQNTVVTSVSGCLGLITQGTRVALLSRSYAISPPPVITPVP
jgi:hypothetical protein